MHPKPSIPDGDGAIDRIYAGDEEGKLWRADYNASSGTWSAKVKFNGSRPITGAPDVAGNTVIFSTGIYFNPSTQGDTG
ncbi:hypothetical protein [Neisseria chenwenguii]|uniref:hypothetical protein n=1 Tax=Neisseria chenwenguii TaxID=1853278 RepID=UPI000F5132B5|nr:hypothetical protein [Neisseria chenwenguii]